MSHNSHLNGVWTAIVTPFAGDQIDWDSFDTLLKQQADAKVHGVVVSGTTGEAPTLSTEEKISLIKRARLRLPGSVRVMAGTGGNCTVSSIELSVAAVQAGADSLLVVTPPYNKPTLEGLKAHFLAISKATKNIPICLYHVPGRTAQTLSAEAISQITAIPNVIAVKEASGDLLLFSKAFLACDSSRVSFLSGDDFTYLPSLSVGGVGCISVASNLYPKAIVQMTEDFGAGNIKRALAIHNILFPLFETLFCETNPGPVKAALFIKKLCKNEFRLPLVEVSQANLKKIQETLTQVDRLLNEIPNL